ncbi:pyridoxamine 5'-phosphate oxidase [Nocardiopsis sp. TSRI0078]|uniref:pyridoxamine 5'-phosphate oxidase family protein n=1 Tax=unclassified Nocardiopsis TaxID=2649073 RepID=UPI00093FCCAD|nr:pyridoxamine 5'-phosphate oxidase family protein [Nocardiopsis sp. TSRI0078]OKI22917.1 pyridoxamine 5'-phosphate oxidase [Nocardiopsis sp. TSRI0078]
MEHNPGAPGHKTHPFDVDAFLARPLVARVAVSDSFGAPTVRPVWFLWEEGAMWWLTGAYAKMSRFLEKDPRAALVVDACDLEELEFLQVIMRGEAEVVPYDEERSRRKLRRYLGEDESIWPTDFRDFDEDTRFIRFVPERTIVQDLSKTRP